MRNIIIIFLLFVSVGLSAQITTNTNFQINSANPIDTRMVLDSLSDTTTVSFAFDGLQAFVKELSEFYVYDSFWKRSNEISGGVDTFYLENGIYNIVSGSDTLTASAGVDFGDIYYVAPDGEGDNATAEVGNPNLPWATIQSAIDSAAGNGTVYVLAGTHTFTFLDPNSHPLSLYMESGATADCNNFVINIDTTVNVFGNGDVIVDFTLFEFEVGYNSYSFATLENVDATWVFSWNKKPNNTAYFFECSKWLRKF